MRAGNVSNGAGVIERMCESEQVEKWLPIPGYEGMYEASDQGRVRSLDRHVPGRDGRRTFYAGRVLRPWRQKSGHLAVSLGRSKRECVHRLVLAAFRGPCPIGQEACHWDDDPSNNHLDNLRWASRSSNGRDRVRNGIDPHASMVQCKYGHPFSPENTHLRPDGGRTCKECRRRRKREENARNRLKRKEVTDIGYDASQ